MVQGIDLMGRVTRTVTVRSCARCGEDHADMLFIKFEIPIEDSDGTLWTWWAECPETKDPVLLKDNSRD